MAPVTRETDAIVLDSRDHGESDLILTLFCREMGRVTAIAKGARKSQKRFVNKLELFTSLRISLRRSSSASLALLEQAELMESFLTIRQHVNRYCAASVIREVVLLATHDGEGDQRLFELMIWAFAGLDAARPHLPVVMLFLLKCWDILGYRPELHRCVHCGRGDQQVVAHGFSTVSGGLVCASCATTLGEPQVRLAAETIATLQMAQDTALEQLHRLQIADQNLYEALNILHRYGRHLLQRELNSWAMLRRTVTTQ